MTCKINKIKHATPVAISGSMEEASAHLDVTRYNAVVNGRSSSDEVDSAVQDHAALQNAVNSGVKVLHLTIE